MIIKKTLPNTVLKSILEYSKREAVLVDISYAVLGLLYLDFVGAPIITKIIGILIYTAWRNAEY